MSRFTLSLSLAAAMFLSGAGGVLAEDADVAAGLSPDILDRIAELRTHGDRFDLAIRQIIAEAARPAWQFEAPAPDTDMAACMQVACLN
ncbi:hypothetical protein HKCCSP123_10285 [Rhodobacterales bacterium HKCCSP123]|nr:hypothetical protein [Rhodobacterales bacterium HKCCSP123]